MPVVLGEVDVLKSLSSWVTNAGEASGFNVRGGGADQNLILLDEEPLLPTFWFSLYLIQMPSKI
jgi:hypothetical protein